MNIIYGRDGNVYETGIRGTTSEPFIQSELVKNELNQLEMQVENLKEQKYSELLKENKQLKMINKEYERLNKSKYRGFKIIDVQEYDRYELLSYKKYKDNWNKLKEYIKEGGFEINTREYGSLDAISKDVIIEIMQELEGSDSNVKD